MFSIRAKMGILLTGISLMSVLLSTLLLTEFDQYHFNQYLVQNVELRNERIARVLAKAYERSGGWNEFTAVDLGEYSMQQGLGIRLLDAEHREIWSFDVPEQFDSGQTVSKDTIPIDVNGNTIGYAELVSSERLMYSELDEHYIAGMTQGFLTSVIVTVLLAMMLSWLISRRITKPLREMIGMSVKLREGDHHLRLSLPKENDELRMLAQSLNHLAEELHKQEKLRKNLAADVAHELRTPLTTLNSHLLAFIDGIWKTTPDRLRACHEEVGRLIELSSDIELLTRTEIESMDLQLLKEDVAQITFDAVQVMELSFENKGVALTFADYGPCYARIDRNKWKQIIINLLENAFKYTDQGGKVTVEVKQENHTRQEAKKKHNKEAQWIRVSVSDTGEGISSEHLPYIFERFYRVDASRTRTTGGAGIGLTIIKNLVQAHGGTIEVDSEAGKGTIFTIRILGAKENPSGTRQSFRKDGDARNETNSHR